MFSKSQGFHFIWLCYNSFHSRSHLGEWHMNEKSLNASELMLVFSTVQWYNNNLPSVLSIYYNITLPARDMLGMVHDLMMIFFVSHWNYTTGATKQKAASKLLPRLWAKKNLNRWMRMIIMMILLQFHFIALRSRSNRNAFISNKWLCLCSHFTQLPCHYYYHSITSRVATDK